MADDLLAQHRRTSPTTAESRTFHYDGLGSTRLLTNAAGVTTDTYAFTAFGELEGSTGITVNDYLYTGEQYDPNLGFYYIRARYYNPAIGRFPTMDTYAGRIFEPKTLHKYLYANVDPISMVDSSGRVSISLAGAAKVANVVLITASVAQAGIFAFDVATGRREPTAKEIGITIILLAAGPAAGRVLRLLARNRVGASAGAALPAGAIKLTEEVIKKKLIGAPLRTQQTRVSIPRIERYVRDMLNGDKFPDIKVDGDIIVDGHHRYIASRIANVNIGTVPGARPTFKQDQPVKELIDLIFDPASY